MATAASVQVVRLSFWARMTLGVSLFIVFGFAQFALRGFVPYGQVPAIFHLHGVTMLTWLGLACTQSVLVGRGAGLAIHRRLGWASVVMLPLILVLASLTCIAGLRAGMFPPFFTPGYFLATVHVGVAVFALTVVGAIVRRHRADWHKRLMVGSTVMLMEPALGRVLPMPFLMPWGPSLAVLVQLGMLAIVWRHDRQELGRVHPATLAAMLALVLSHILTHLLAATPAWIALAAGFSA